MTTEQALKECQLFATLDGALVAKIAKLAVVKEYNAGSTIIQEGDSADELFVLQEGKVAIQMTLPESSGQISRRMTVDLVSPNEVIGWSAVVEPSVSTTSSVCLQKVKALAINGAKLRWLLQNEHQTSGDVLKELIKVVAARLNDSRQMLVSERLVPSRPS